MSGGDRRTKAERAADEATVEVRRLRGAYR
jgi:hypothetical protein